MYVYVIQVQRILEENEVKNKHFEKILNIFIVLRKRIRIRIRKLVVFFIKFLQNFTFFYILSSKRTFTTFCFILEWERVSNTYLTRRFFAPSDL